MKKTIKLFSVIQTSSDQNKNETQSNTLVTHRLRPRRRQQSQSQTKSLSNCERSAVSTNELLSSLSTKLDPRSISVSTDSRWSQIKKQNIQMNISCLDQISVPRFRIKQASNDILNYQELKKRFNISKIKKITTQIGCVHKAKKICMDPSCQVKQKWKNKLILSIKQSKQAEMLKNYVLKSHQQTNQDIQINKDVPRSFPCDRQTTKTGLTLYHTSISKSNLLDTLGLVLKMLAFSDPQVGYVQGMNLYSACIISHIKQVESSFLFIKEIMKYGNMRKMYIKSFKQMRELCNRMLHRHIRILMADLYQHFMQGGISIQLFMPFYLSMFANVIEFQHMHDVIDEFMTKGFLFYDKLMLCILCYLKDQLLSCDALQVACKLGTSNIRSCQIPWSDVINLTEAFQLN